MKHPGHQLVPVKRLRSVALRTAGTVVLACVVSLAPAAHASDGGFPAVYAERARLLVPGGEWQDSACWADGDGGTACSGAWVPAPRLLEVGRELAQHRAEQPPTAPPVTPVAVVVALACGVVLGGAAVGWLWTRVGH